MFYIHYYRINFRFLHQEIGGWFISVFTARSIIDSRHHDCSAGKIVELGLLYRQ